MYAIISVLDPNASTEVYIYWKKLSLGCGLNAIFHMPTPHLTWMVCQDLDVDHAAPLISHVSSQKGAITSRSSGLGIFTGDNPVLYLPIVKSQEMIGLHKVIWDLLKPLTRTTKEFYSPIAWVPHITLALNDLTKEKLACAVNSIAFEEIALNVTIDNLCIAEYEKDIAGEIIEKFQFPMEDQQMRSSV